jgi:hypothetical protein
VPSPAAGDRRVVGGWRPIGEQRPHEQRALEVGGHRRALELHRRQPGLDPALALDGVAALVTGVDVVPRTILVGLGQLAVEKGADAGSEVADHVAVPGLGTPGRTGPW